MPSLPSLAESAEAIRSMRVRGAAAIAQTAAAALADHVARSQDGVSAAEEGARVLLAARPTAVSLRHGVERVLRAVRSDPGNAGPGAQAAARRFGAELAGSRDALARHAASQVGRAGTVLTHCHSTTAVAVLVAAHRMGPGLRVFATETRPFGQGLLTARALREAGVDVTLVVDSAVEHVLATERPGLVLVGADTVARDGSLFNKIGTAGVAALAGLHRIPFLSAAGFYKFGDIGPGEVAIEERPGSEVVPNAVVPPGLKVRNPVFDRTPPERIAAYLTETGALAPAAAVRQALARLRSTEQP